MTGWMPIFKYFLHYNDFTFPMSFSKVLPEQIWVDKFLKVIFAQVQINTVRSSGHAYSRTVYEITLLMPELLTG